MSLEQGEHLRPASDEDNVIRHQNCIDSLLAHLCKDCVDFTIGAGEKNFCLPPHGHSRRMCVLGHAIDQG